MRSCHESKSHEWDDCLLGSPDKPTGNVYRCQTKQLSRKPTIFNDKRQDDCAKADDDHLSVACTPFLCIYSEYHTSGPMRYYTLTKLGPPDKLKDCEYPSACRAGQKPVVIALDVPISSESCSPLTSLPSGITVRACDDSVSQRTKKCQ